MDNQSSDGSTGSGGNDEEYQFPDAVKVPPSVDSSLLKGDIVDILKQMSVDRINSALEQYDHQLTQRGSEIRNPRAYLRGILRGNANRYGLPNGVFIPTSITQSMLEDKELIAILKPMSVRDINSCFRDFDDQIRKKSDNIRNKEAYLMGIIRSGPHYNLPQGVALPSSVSLDMLQGELLETIQQLPAAHINVALNEYDEQIKKKSDIIRNRQGYLLGIMKRMKRSFEEEATEHVASHKQHPSSHLSPGKNKREDSRQQHNSSIMNSPRNENGARSESTGNNSNARETATKNGEPPNTLNMMTESFVKVTNELVVERKAKKHLEDQLKEEMKRKEEKNQRALQLMSALASEREQRERSAMEVERLQKDLTFERALRETAEEKVQVLEEKRNSTLFQPHKLHPDLNEQEQISKLEMELSIERGLRQNTEKLLQTAENRISELNRELQYVQDKLKEERMKSPFSWTGATLPSTDGQETKEDKKTSEFPPGLTGYSDLMSSLTGPKGSQHSA